MTTRRRLLSGWSPVAVAVLGGMGLAACRTAPVYNASGVSFVGRGSLRERAEAVRRAAVLQGWSPRDVRAGVIQLTKSDGSHYATVTVTFDLRSFAIGHDNSSPNLRYDGAQIHVLYNEWVQQLERAIVNVSA